MSTTALVIFPESERAFDALAVMEATDGSVFRASVVATKDLKGNLSLTRISKDRFGGTTAMTFICGLAGLPLGAVAMIIAAVSGALIGATADYLNNAGELQQATHVVRDLGPGTSALIVDLPHDNMAALNSLMCSFDGTVSLA